MSCHELFLSGSLGAIHAMWLLGLPPFEVVFWGKITPQTEVRSSKGSGKVSWEDFEFSGTRLKLMVRSRVENEWWKMIRNSDLSSNHFTCPWCYLDLYWNFWKCLRLLTRLKVKNDEKWVRTVIWADLLGKLALGFYLCLPLGLSSQDFSSPALSLSTF